MTTSVFKQATDFFIDDIILINSCTFTSNSSYYELDELKITLISFGVDVINERFCISISHFTNQLWVFSGVPGNWKMCALSVYIYIEFEGGVYSRTEELHMVYIMLISCT